MGNGLSVFIGIVSDEKVETGAIVEKLLAVEGVVEAFELTGSFDILLRAESGSVSELNAIVEGVRATEGVTSTQTYLILGRKP
jgi:DNA-binding Lrp family transcriptional regulator